MNSELKVIDNIEITNDIYLLKLESDVKVIAGQFFMLKAANTDTTLYRPISIFDSSDSEISFLYMIRGSGTKALSKLKRGDSLLVHGPYGNGFTNTNEKLALVGGGIGMAPLYMCAKNNPDSKIYIGVRSDRYTSQDISNIKSIFDGVDVHIKVGGTVIDDIDFKRFEGVFCCGPTGMMKAISSYHDNTYVSLENHMGCGVGACLSCSCKTTLGMKKTCKDGPVFRAEEVVWQ